MVICNLTSQLCHALFGLVWPVGNTPCVVLLLVQPEEGCQRHDAGLAAQKSHIMHASLRLDLGTLGSPELCLDGRR